MTRLVHHQPTQQRIEAFKSFEHHVLTVIQPGFLYRFAKPGTNNMSASIVTTPEAVIVYGDIGECIWPHHRLPWLAGSLDSPEYCMEKVSSEINKVAFDRDLVTEYLADTIKDLEEEQAEEEKGSKTYKRLSNRLEAAKELQESPFNSAHEAYDALYESDLDIDDPPSLERISDRMYIIMDMLKHAVPKIMEKLDAALAAPENTQQPSTT
jgi:hypothetical protein